MNKLITLLVLSLFVFGCSDNDDDRGQTDALVGKWSFNSITVEDQGLDAHLAAVTSADKKNREKHMKDTYIEFTKNGKYTDTSEGIVDADYYTKDGFIFFKEKSSTDWEKWPYQLSSTNNTVFTYVMDETDEYKGMYPDYGVIKVVFNYVYLKN